METDALFQEYAATPRPPALAPGVVAQVRKAWVGLLVALLGSFVLGVPLSLVRFVRSRPWEPTDMALMGAILAAFTVPIAAVFVGSFTRYAALYQTGRLVEGTVIEQRPAGIVLQVAVDGGPDRSLLPQYQAAIGQRFPVIVQSKSSFALVIVGRMDLRRASLMTAQQAAQRSGA
jgi:hypothetical protein